MTETRNAISRRLAAVLFGIVPAALLSACAMSDDTVSSFLVAPGKYVLFSCDDIARTAKATQARQKELEQLMAKAGTGAGQLISDATYGPDYATARGEMNGLRAAAVERKCNFVPGVDSPDARASDRALH